MGVIKFKREKLFPIFSIHRERKNLGCISKKMAVLLSKTPGEVRAQICQSLGSWCCNWGFSFIYIESPITELSAIILH